MGNLYAEFKLFSVSAKGPKTDGSEGLTFLFIAVDGAPSSAMSLSRQASPQIFDGSAGQFLQQAHPEGD